MALIPEEKVDEVRNATDLVDLISRYVPDLRRSGSGFKAPCPFHQEKTPSFHVWPETQTFKCFGCQKGGNCFHFVMERERLTFPEAVQFLAREAGIELGPLESRGPGEGDRQRLLDLLEWACRYFQAVLRAEAGHTAVEYCRRRRIEGETARAFRLGYAPAGWRGLADAAARKGWPAELLRRAGLTREGRRGDDYDWFRDRLIFPIQNVRGRVIAFGGRALDDSEPKYLNSPDTAVFKKGRTLYGLHLARDEALAKRRLGLVEGYTDVLMAHQHGIAWTVAGLGTGLTRDHAALVRRYADRVDLVYDADRAGLGASERALDAFLEVEADVRVVQLPGGLDPCDFLLERGGDAFLAALDGGQEVFDFLAARAGEKNDLATLAGRLAAVDEVLSTVARTANAVKRDLLIVRTAEAFGVSEAAVRERLRLFSGRRDALETGTAAAVEEHLEEEPAERLVIEAVVCRTELIERLANAWPPERFRHPVYRAIAQAAVSARGGNGELVDPGRILDRLPDPAAAEILTALLSEGSRKKDLEGQFRDCVDRLRLRSRIEETREALERARESGDEEEKRRLERELFRLRSRRR